MQLRNSEPVAVGERQKKSITMQNVPYKFVWFVQPVVDNFIINGDLLQSKQASRQARQGREERRTTLHNFWFETVMRSI